MNNQTDKGSVTCAVFSTLALAYWFRRGSRKKHKHIPHLKFYVNKAKNVEYVRRKLAAGQLPDVYKDTLTGVIIISEFESIISSYCQHAFHYSRFRIAAKGLPMRARKQSTWPSAQCLRGKSRVVNLLNTAIMAFQRQPPKTDYSALTMASIKWRRQCYRPIGRRATMAWETGRTIEPIASCGPSGLRHHSARIMICAKWFDSMRRSWLKGKRGIMLSVNQIWIILSQVQL